MKIHVSRNTETVFYFISIFLIQLESFGSSIRWFNPIRQSVILPAIILLILASLMNLRLGNFKITPKRLFLIIACLLASLLSYHFTNNMIAVYLTLLLFANVGKDYKKPIMADMIVKVMILIFITMNYSLGLTENYFFARGERTRAAFGFSHPNSLGYFLTVLYSDIMILYQEKLRNNKLGLLLFVLVCVPLMLADSRTAIICIAIYYIASLLKGRKNHTVIRAYLLPALPLILLIITIVLTIFYKNGYAFAKQINYVTSGRLFWQSFYLENYPINLFGRKMSFRHLPLDNGYLRIVINYGLLGIIIAILPYMLSLRKSQNNNIVKKTLLIMCFYALMEWMPLRISTTPLGAYFIMNNIEEKKHEKNDN